MRRLLSRSSLAFLLPITIVWSGWLALMVAGDRFALFATEWFMSVTMAFGSFVAGATSEGGGAVGVILGLEALERWPIPPAFAKMLFTSTWLAFAFALYWVNRYRDREVYRCIEHILVRHPTSARIRSGSSSS